MSVWYLYLDDSGKFHKETDNNISYSFVLLNKKQRKQFEKGFSKTWWKIANPTFKSQYTESDKRRMESDFINETGYGKDKLLTTFYKETPKAQAFISRYNRSIKTQYGENTPKDFEDFLNLFSIPEEIGTMTWCKKCSSPVDWSSLSEEQEIGKKKFMVLTIIKKLLDNKNISKGDEVKVYIDHEFNSQSDLMLGLDFQNYLNIPIPDPEETAITGYKINGMLYKLRMCDIKCDKCEFLDSSMSIYVRAADLLANASYKSLGRKFNGISDPSNLWEYIQSKRQKNMLMIKYPKFVCGINIAEITCHH